MDVLSIGIYLSRPYYMPGPIQVIVTLTNVYRINPVFLFFDPLHVFALAEKKLLESSKHVRRDGNKWQLR